ncbi:ComEA family DNA-binding protein [Azospirillum sp. Marseille-Q6669]
MGSGSSSSTAKAKVIDLNTAGKDELQTLPGIGEARSEAIVKNRPTVPRTSWSARRSSRRTSTTTSRAASPRSAAQRPARRRRPLRRSEPKFLSSSAHAQTKFALTRQADLWSAESGERATMALQGWFYRLKLR